MTKKESSRYQHLAAIPEDTVGAATEAHNQVGEPISAARVADAIGELPSAPKTTLVSGRSRRICIASI